MLNKTIMLLFAVSFFTPGFVPFSYSASNLAFKKTYTVSPAANYPLSAPATDKTALTDGKYTRGILWTRKTTLGWQDKNQVEVLIDLGQIFNIDGVSFSTARGKNAGVNFPAVIAAFIGADQNHLVYAGNIAKDPDNIPGAYKTKKFQLKNIGVKGRYLFLVIVPFGRYLFCDEIEVFEGMRDNGAEEALTLADAHGLSVELRKLSIEKAFLVRLIEKIKSTSDLNPEHERLISKIELQCAKLETLEDVATLEADLFRLRAKILRAQFPGRNFLINSVNPWAPLSPASALVAASPQNISITIPQNGYHHAAFVVTNLTTVAQQVAIQSNELPNNTLELDYYHVPFVKSAAMECVADPLVPVNGKLTLKAGESIMIFLAVHGLKPGVWSGLLNINVDEWVTTVPLQTRVSSIALPNKLTINSVNWGYLDFEPIRDVKTQAAADLISHYTNVSVVPSRYIPLSDRPSALDLARFKKYLALNQGAEKIMFFLNFRGDGQMAASGGHTFMTDEWKEWFKGLYARLVRCAIQAGFSRGQLYLYPYDEVGGKDIDRFLSLASWAKTAIASIQFYATLNKQEALKVLPYLDIAQVIDRKDLLNAAKLSKKEIWLYDAARNTKSLAPYSYYRLMPWRAFVQGFTGAGFWNYADTGWGENPGSAWDDFDGNRPDFAVIYEGAGGTIISSRRWEAWRIGLEDYELLTMYGKTRGNEAAKALARQVIAKPLQFGEADEVRNIILRELSQ